MSRSQVRGALSDTALRSLWDEHAGPVYALALRLSGGDRVRAEDVVQETLLRAWQHPEVLDSAHESVRPWLFTVARRILIDHHRAARIRPDGHGAPDPGESSVDDGIDEALDRWLVADALSALTPVHREALVHTYYAGRTVAEAAVLLGIPVGTVKSRVFYALRALKLALEERGVSA